MCVCVCVYIYIGTNYLISQSQEIVNFCYMDVTHIIMEWPRIVACLFYILMSLKGFKQCEWSAEARI